MPEMIFLFIFFSLATLLNTSHLRLGHPVPFFVSAVAVCLVICTDALPASLVSIMANIVGFSASATICVTAFVNTFVSLSFFLFFYLLAYCFINLLLLTPCNVICLIRNNYVVDLAAYHMYFVHLMYNCIFC